MKLKYVEGVRIKLVIFDLDETIVENTIPFSEMRERILGEMGVKDAPRHLYEFLKAKGEEYLKLLEREEIRRAKKARIMSSLPRVLEYLNEMGIKKAVLTRNSKKATMIALGDYAKKFDAIITREDEFEPKPSDEGVRYLLEKFNAMPKECIMVGDYDYDIIAGRRAGCITVGVRMDKGDYRVEEVGDLISLISKF